MVKRIYTIVLLLLAGGMVAAQENSLSLSGAISLALENNYGIRISRADAGIAGINNSWGNAGRYPVAGFDLSSQNSVSFGESSLSSRLNAGAGVSWTIFDGFRVSLTKERLSQLENLAEGRSDVVVENTIEDVILAYHLVLLNQKRSSILETLVKLSEDRYNYEMARKEYGNSGTFDVLTAKNNYLEDRAELLNQQVLFRNAVRNLNFLMGVESSGTWLFTGQFAADTTGYRLTDLMDKMLSGNVSLQNQYINRVIAENSSMLAGSDYYPSVRLSAGVDNSSVFSPSAARGNSFSGYANATLSYDIFKAGQRSRAIEIARIGEEISLLEAEELTRSLQNQVMTLFDQYNVRRELLALSSENLEAAELNLRIAEEKYRSGAINSFNYRDIQLIYLNSAYRQAEAVYNLVTSRTALTRITGGFINREAGSN